MLSCADPPTHSRSSAMPWHQGWPPLLLLPGAAILFGLPILPPWAFMWALAFAIYAACKWLTWRRTPVPAAPLWKHAGYLLAWPGLDAAAFLGPSTAPRPRARDWLFAALKLTLGLILLCAVVPRLPADYPYLVGWAGMIGIILVLHFGVFHLLSCVWRHLGVEARPLMNWPLAAVKVSDFWGRRWNTAFRDLTHRFLFRPLTARLGPRWAIFLGFLASGLVHDLVISLPAGAGFGGPTLYFLVQAIAIFVERSTIGRRMGLGHGLPGWLFTMLVLLAPVGALFHPAFVYEVVLPFLQILPPNTSAGAL